MKITFSKGDTRLHIYQVKPEDTAKFETGEVHPVCSTFVIAREMEWAGRLFVLEMKDKDEEGIGTRLEIRHRSPAAVGSTLHFEAEFQGFDKEDIIVNVRVFSGERMVAEGLTGQRILSREKINHLFSKI